MKEAVIIDGSFGEGGGQILRSSLSLSMITGRPFKIKNIRAGRKKPGLMRQHLTCVKSAAQICDAKITGAEIGSQELTFIPKEIKGGDYQFAIGTAGSTMLVAQTILPALIFAGSESSVILEGGTHNIHAPTYDFIKQSYLPVLEKMGASIDAEIHKFGFYPVGGGKVSFNIKPAEKLRSIELLERGELKDKSAEVILANVPFDVAERELKKVSEKMEWSDDVLHTNQVKGSASSGNVISLTLEYDGVTEVFVELGAYGVKAEKVAKRVCSKALKYLEHEAVAGEHLADQLLLPMALAGSGKFKTVEPSLHARTNIGVIQKFLPCSIDMEETNNNFCKISFDGKPFLNEPMKRKLEKKGN